MPTRFRRLWPLLLLTSAACAPTLDELDFFEVKTLPARPGAQLGQIALSDSIANIGPLGAEEHGFVWSDDAASVAAEAPVSQLPRIRLGRAPKDGTYRDTVLMPDERKTYYFRAYAQRGERMVYAPQTESFALNLSLTIETTLLQTDNDRIYLTAQVRGLTKLNTAVTAHGFVWSAVREVPDMALDSVLPKGPLDRDDFFRDTLRHLEPGKKYYVRAFLQAGSKAFFSEVSTLSVKEIWVPAPSAPFVGNSVWGAFSATGGGKALVGCGCRGLPSNGYQCGGGSDELSEIWEFDPATESWSKWPGPFSSGLRRYSPTAFVIGPHLYVGAGGSRDNFGPFINKSFFKFSIADRKELGLIPDFPLNTLNAAAFVLDGKAYVGTGTTLSPRVTNEFFVFEPLTETWDTVAPLPHSTGIGRHGAAAFAIGQRGYVFGGFRSSAIGTADIFATALGDCWAYDPAQDVWAEMAPFPGEARADATAFVLGDTAAVVGLGYGATSGFLNDWWLFEPSKGPKGKWSKIAPRFEPGRADAFGFALQGRGYVGGGRAIKATNLGYVGFLLDDAWKYVRD